MQLQKPVAALLFAGAWAGGIYDGWKHGIPYKTIDCAARMPEEPCMAHDCYGVRGGSAGGKRDLSVTSYLALREVGTLFSFVSSFPDYTARKSDLTVTPPPL